MEINLMIDDVPFKRKPNGAECGAIKARASPRGVRFDELISVIESGKTIAPAVMSGTKAADWKEQQLFEVDVDNGDNTTALLTPEMAIAICQSKGIMAAFHYPTFSHTDDKPKFRLGFIMSEVVREESKRKLIVESLIEMLPQSDKSCKNADRLFFGTNRKVVIVDENARVGIEDIYHLRAPPKNPKMPIKNELDRLKQDFDLLSYMRQRNGKCREINGGYIFDDCELCGHHNDLVYYSDTNTFYCFGANCSKGGSIIDYIILTENADVKTAIGKLYQMSGRSPPRHSEFTNDDWQQPIPFNDFDLPGFPINTYPEVFKTYAESVAEHTQTSIDMPAMSIIGVIATAVQGKMQMESKANYIEPLNVYVLIIAKPAERKSGVNQETTSILKDYEKRKNDELKPQIDLQSIRLEILERNLKTAINAGDEENANAIQTQIREIVTHGKHFIRLFTDDTSSEALTSLLYENNGRMSIISAEGGIFATLGGRYSNNIPNIDTVLKAHSGDKIRVDRKNRESERIDNPCLTMVISMQESVLNELFANEQFRGRGLVARMLFCRPTSKIGRREFETEPILPEVKKAYEEAVNQLLEYAGSNVPLVLTNSANAVAKDWFQYLEPLHNDDLVFMSDWSGKLYGATLRIAGLLHCMRYYNNIANNRMVDMNTMQDAVEIGKYLLEHAKWAYAFMGADVRIEQAKYVLKKIIQSGKEELSSREAIRLCRQFGKTRELIPVLEFLEEHRFIRGYEIAPTHAGSKPRVMYEVNPYVTNVTDVTEI